MKQSNKINPHEAALHGDYKYIKDSLEKLIISTESQQQKIEKLEAFVSYYANCPCCDQNEECLEGCTFKEDLPDDYALMQDAREAMK